MNACWRRLRAKAVDVRPNELRALCSAFAFNFLILASYYVMRPIRDDIAAASGVEKLPWMFTGTLVVMLLANAAFAAIVARLSRRKFIPIAYRFFHRESRRFFSPHANLPAGAEQVWIGRAFFVWVSVFNLFVVAIFWAFMTDLFNIEQGKRLLRFHRGRRDARRDRGRLLTAARARSGRRTAPDLRGHVRDRGAVRAVFPGGVRGKSEPLRREEAEGGTPIGGTLWSGLTHVGAFALLVGICAFHAPLHDHFDLGLFSAGRYHRAPNFMIATNAPFSSRNSRSG